MAFDPAAIDTLAGVLEEQAGFLNDFRAIGNTDWLL